jgi:hypothetical protein
MEQAPFARTKRRHKLKSQKEGMKMRGIMKIVAVVGLVVVSVAGSTLAQQQQPTATVTVQCEGNTLTIDKPRVQLKQGHTVAYQFTANLNTCVQGLASAKITFSDSTPLQTPTPQPQGWPAIVVNITTGQPVQAGPFNIKTDVPPGGYPYKIEFFNQRDAQGTPSATLDKQIIMIQPAPPFIHRVTIEISGRAEAGNLFIKIDDRDPVPVTLKGEQAIKEIRDAAVTALNNQQAGTAQATDDNKILVNADKKIEIGTDPDKLSFLAFDENKSVAASGLIFKVIAVSAEITLFPSQNANDILVAAAVKWIIAEARWTQNGAILGDPIKELTGQEVTSIDVGFGDRFGTVKLDDKELKLTPPQGANDILIVAKEEWVIKEAWWTQNGKKLGDKQIEGLVGQKFQAVHGAINVVKISMRIGPPIIPVIPVLRWESRSSRDPENRVVNIMQVVPQLGKCGILNNVDIINRTNESGNDFEVVVEGSYAHIEMLGPQPELLYYPAYFEQISQGTQTLFRWRWARGVPPGKSVHLGLWVWAPDCNIRIKSITLTRDGRVIGKVPASSLGVTSQGQIIIINNLDEPIEIRNVQVAQASVPLPLPSLNVQDLPKRVSLEPVPASGTLNPGQALSLPMLNITVSPSSAETNTAADIRLKNIGTTTITIKSVTVTRPNSSVDTVITNLKLQPGEAKTERYANTGLVGTYTVKAIFDSAEVTEKFERFEKTLPSFRISVSASPPFPCSGETVTININVRNVGNGSGTADIELRIDGSVRDRWSRSLAPGGSSTDTYRTSFSPGRHTIEARVFWQGSLHDSGSTTIEARSGTFFSVSSLEAPSSVRPNESFNVSAIIRNSGCSFGSQTIRFLVDGLPRDSTRVSLGAGESTKVSFRWSFSSRGSYRVTIASEDDSSSTTIRVGDDIPTLTEWGLIALGLLLAGSLAVMIRRRFARPAAAA